MREIHPDLARASVVPTLRRGNAYVSDFEVLATRILTAWSADSPAKVS